MVNVNVDIGERRIERNFSGVMVTTSDGGKVQPSTTSITLLGGPNMMDTLKPEEIRIVLDSGKNLEPRLQLPDSLNGKVILKSVHTSKFVPLR